VERKKREEEESDEELDLYMCKWHDFGEKEKKKDMCQLLGPF
jgi:hypothetical protein